MGLFIIGEDVARGFEHRLARGVFFELADLEFCFFEFGLAGFHQPGALLESGQQRFQGKIARLHRFHDGFELLQSFLEWEVFGGRSLARALGCVRHGGESRAKHRGRLVWSRAIVGDEGRTARFVIQVLLLILISSKRQEWDYEYN